MPKRTFNGNEAEKQEEKPAVPERLNSPKGITKGPEPTYMRAPSSVTEALALAAEKKEKKKRNEEASATNLHLLRLQFKNLLQDASYMQIVKDCVFTTGFNSSVVQVPTVVTAILPNVNGIIPFHVLLTYFQVLRFLLVSKYGNGGHSMDDEYISKARQAYFNKYMDIYKDQAQLAIDKDNKDDFVIANECFLYRALVVMQPQGINNKDANDPIDIPTYCTGFVPGDTGINYEKALRHCAEFNRTLHFIEGKEEEGDAPSLVLIEEKKDWVLISNKEKEEDEKLIEKLSLD